MGRFLRRGTKIKTMENCSREESSRYNEKHEIPRRLINCVRDNDSRWIRFIAETNPHSASFPLVSTFHPRFLLFFFSLLFFSFLFQPGRKSRLPRCTGGSDKIMRALPSRNDRGRDAARTYRLSIHFFIKS